MPKYLIVANWKMNPSTEKEALKLFESIKKGIRNVKNTEVVICPPFVYLSALAAVKGKLALGAQNVFYKEAGAFAGEVSPVMLKDLNIKYVILGHSEIRKNFNETDEVINKKIKECLTEKLKPILCVGEKEDEDKGEVLNRQITEGLKGIPNSHAYRQAGKFKISNLVIAYEPVWAIGTGKNCSLDETMRSVLLIKKTISKLYGRQLAGKVKILYGGSVDGENSRSYIKEGGVNGLLVGGSSLDKNDFIKIVKSAG